MKILFLVFLALLLSVDQVAAQEFAVKVLSEQFFSEGATFADINGDGHQDIVSGPFWYAGPDFEQRTRYMAGESVPIKQYSPHFFTFADDFNSDRRPDLLVIPIPGAAAHWFENPGNTIAAWKQHPVLESVDNESPGMYDLTDNGQLELVCIHQGDFGYAAPDSQSPTSPWKFIPISKDQKLGRFTHGLGVGDVNGDGRNDLLETRGWWEQPTTRGDLFKFHPYPFAQSGGSQMFACDFDGDGDNDVLSVQNAHAYGLNWFEQRGSNNDIGFVKHEILPNKETPGGLNLSQMHAVALADMDGDGQKDIITGKRFFAHGGGDPGAFRQPALYWFKNILQAGAVRFEPKLIHPRVGVGTQLTVRDITGDNRPEIVVGNKLGTFLITPAASSAQPASKLQQQIGSAQFSKPVRDTAAQTTVDELASFVLPEGFDIQLVTSEPDIAKPMNLAFDAKGRLWVSSSLEYPFAAPPDREPRDSIRILEDTNGDGQRDKVTVFADKLNIPMGLYPYQDGVICFSIPNIWFLRDTDGDGRCDKREKLFGPMGFERDTHGMCNAFTRGYDGWLYACHGFNNHTDVAGADGHGISMKSGNTFRMKLDGSRIEHFTHGLVNPFGMAIDQHADHFVADCHTKPVSLLLAGGYYDSFGKPHDGLGYVPNVMEHLHGSTAIGGIAICHNREWPEEFQGSTFGGNVMTSRINRNSLHYAGSSPMAREEPDFLMSGDPWFRPVDLQFGPDGALYVADFYNRIIGHYEVDLKHPGRDRTSGRIWRIAYTGKNRRLTAASSGHQSDAAADLTRFTATELIRQLSSSNQARRMLIADRIVDHFGPAAVNEIRTALPDGDGAKQHLLWILERLQAITPADLSQTLKDPDPLVRQHAVQVIGALIQPPGPTVDWLMLAMTDGHRPAGQPASGFVSRSAVMAMAQHPSESYIKPLADLYRTTAAHDVFLKHAIRMTLRDHLQKDEWFTRFTANILPADVELVSGLCLALNTRASGEFIVHHIEAIAVAHPQELTDFMRVAVRYVSADSFGPLTATARKRFADSPSIQLELLQSARAGLQQRGSDTPTPIHDWAVELADQLLGDPATPQTLNWTYHADPRTPNQGNPWVVTNRRTSQDGEQNSVLFSSIPNGEQRTGIYRSDEFPLGDSFSFYMAGHDGFPKGDAGKKNGVRLRDAVTHQVIQTFWPPRNDVAHRYEWKRTNEPAKNAYAELFDGDTATAYAWIAVGRFSDARLNPNSQTGDRRKGAKLAGEFRLEALRPKLIATLSQTLDRDTESLVAASLVRLSPDSRMAAIALIPTVIGADQLRSQAKQLILKHSAPQDATIAAIKDRKKQVAELLAKAFSMASATEQLELASSLSVDRYGADELLSLIESGRAAASLLQRPVIADRLNNIDGGALKSKVEMLISNLPSLDAQVAQRITQWKSQYLSSASLNGQPQATAINQQDSKHQGRILFEKNCAICHQVAGQGKKVGPNLDGIGNRGVDRVIEDILDPSRNVDINFRATTIITAAGKVHSGLLKPSTGDQTILIDSAGKEITIPTNGIEEKKTGVNSPMPANVHEILKPNEFRDLLAYLLSLRQ